MGNERTNVWVLGFVSYSFGCGCLDSFGFYAEQVVSTVTIVNGVALGVGLYSVSGVTVVFSPDGPGGVVGAILSALSDS